MKTLPFKATTILNYGPTGSGKTSHLAELAKYLFKTSGGKIKDGKAIGGLRTRLYLSDSGSIAPLEPIVDVGILEVVDVRVLPHPFLWAMKAAAGLVPKITGTDAQTSALKGTWERVDNSHIGLFAYDSLTSIAERMFDDLSDKAAAGVDIGGEGAYKFTDGDAVWGKVTIGASNRTHYNVAQRRISLFCDHITQLASRENALVYATCMEDRGESETSRATVIGPKTIGRAMTDQLPRMFGLTFHTTLEVTTAVKEPTHKMWLVSHQDRSAGNVIALANRRLPMIAPGEKTLDGLPVMLDPADIVKAIGISQQMLDAAKAALAKEMV